MRFCYGEGYQSLRHGSYLLGKNWIIERKRNQKLLWPSTIMVFSEYYPDGYEMVIEDNIKNEISFKICYFWRVKLIDFIIDGTWRQQFIFRLPLSHPVFTAHNEVVAKVIFLYLFVILFTGGVVVSQKALRQIPQPGTPRTRHTHPRPGTPPPNQAHHTPNQAHHTPKTRHTPHGPGTSHPWTRQPSQTRHPS